MDDGIGQAIGPLLEDPDLLIVVTADHSTPSAGQLIHSGEPVPLLFHGEGVRRDSVFMKKWDIPKRLQNASRFSGESARVN